MSLVTLLFVGYLWTQDSGSNECTLWGLVNNSNSFFTIYSWFVNFTHSRNVDSLNGYSGTYLIGCVTQFWSQCFNNESKNSTQTGHLKMLISAGSKLIFIRHPKLVKVMQSIDPSSRNALICWQCLWGLRDHVCVCLCVTAYVCTLLIMPNWVKCTSSRIAVYKVLNTNYNAQPR